MQLETTGVYQKMLNRADLFLVLTDVWKDFFSDMVDRDKIHVLQNAVPVPKMPKTDYSSHTAVFLGRLCPEKGVDELLDCVGAVWKKHPDFHLVLGGFWENGTEELQKKAKSWKRRELSNAPAGYLQSSAPSCLSRAVFLSCRRGLKDSRFLC